MKIIQVSKEKQIKIIFNVRIVLKRQNANMYSIFQHFDM